MLPIVKGITEVQRKGKKAFTELFDKKSANKTIYLTNRNKIFAIVLSVGEYEKLTNENSTHENKLWLQAAETSLDFWNDPSNDIYEQLL